jgi:tetratricopeptide (TPR) repeat protein
VYRGARVPTLHARIVAVARRYNDLLTPEPGLSPPAPEAAIALLASELGEATDRTVLRTLVSALGLFPPGTVVELSSGEVGEVVADAGGARGGGERGLARLRVRVAMDARGGVLAAPQDIDLSRPGETRRVARVVNIDGWRKASEPARPARPTEPSSPSRSAVVATDPRIPIAPLADSLPPPPPPPVIAPPPPLPRFEAERPVAAAPPPPPPGEDESFPPPDFGDEVGTSPSAVAEAMGRMIEDALRAGPAPADPFATEPPAPIAHVPTPPPPTAPPAPRQWRISDAPPKPDNASTLADIKAAAPVTPPPPEPLSHIPTARGTLGATPLAHVLVYMLDHALSGSIVFREPDALEHVLYFQHGAVSKVQISRPSSRIGDELVASGLVSRAVITEAVEGARHLGLLLGEYLVGHDLVSREALSRALEAQIASRVASIVNLLPETTYSFYRDVDLLTSLESEGVVSDPLNVILATVRAWHDRARIRATLSRIAKHPLALHPQADSTHLTLTVEERAVMDFVRASQPTASALFQRRMADEDAVSSLVYALAVTRQFALKGQRGAPMGGRGAALPISVAPPAAPDAVPLRFPGTARAPNFSGLDLGDDVGRASALPPEPAPLNPDESRPLPAFRDRSSRLPEPASLTERPAPLGMVRSNSEVAGAERALEAMGHFRLAEAAVQRSDLAEAHRLAARAVAADPTQTDYIVFQTWVRAMANGKDDAAVDSIQSLTRILQTEPENERALLYRGKLLKKVGRLRDALRDFDRLVQNNPRHREAITEARLLRSKPK